MFGGVVAAAGSGWLRTIVGFSLWALVAAAGCRPTAVAPPPAAIRRIAVLPPQGLDGADANAAAAAQDPRLTLGEVLAAAARTQLAEQGFTVVDPIRVAAATGGRQPSSAAAAAQIVAEADLDATALFIAVQIWQPTHEGMRTDSIIVAMDVALVDPQTAQVLWHAHRSAKPVPLYGVLLTGQADVFAAETVMREMLAPLGPSSAAG